MNHQPGPFPPVLRIPFLSAVLVSCGPEPGAEAEPPPGPQTGPNGGRVIDRIDPNAEIFVTPDRFLQVTFLNDHLEAIPPAGQIADGLVQSESGQLVPLRFSQTGNVLRSLEPLPEGDGLSIVARIKPNRNSDFVSERFNLVLSPCPVCAHPAYACGHPQPGPADVEASP